MISVPEPNHIFYQKTLASTILPIPGIVQSISVSGAVEYADSHKSYSPKAISVSLLLVGELVGENAQNYAKIAWLEEIFKVGNRVEPIYVYHAHLLTRGVNRVILEQLSTSDTVNSDAIVVNLSLREYSDPIVRVSNG